MSPHYPKNITEASSYNYAVATTLHHLIVTYKGFSDNRFVDYLNTMNFVDDKGNAQTVTDVREISDEKEGMQLVLFFEGEDECVKYNFSHGRVVRWFRGYVDTRILGISWK